MQIKAMKNNEISKSQQRSKQKRDKLTLIDSFNDPSEIATKMYCKYPKFYYKYLSILISIMWFLFIRITIPIKSQIL